MEPNAIVPISPEQLEIAQTFLKTSSIEDTATQLGIDALQVSQYLAKPEIKRYIDAIYLNAGFRNRNKLAETLDNIIEKKLLELEEADIGSSKDIADLIALAHKMRMEELKQMQELEKQQQTIKNQTNIQINETPFGAGNYGKLLSELLGG